MMIFAQIEGASEAIKAAAGAGRGYEPVVVVVVLIAFMVGLASMAKWFISAYDRLKNSNDEILKQQIVDAKQREDRMAKRIDDLEDFIRETLLAEVRDSKDAFRGAMDAIENLRKAIDARPCLLSEEKRDEFSDRVTAALAEHIQK